MRYLPKGWLLIVVIVVIVGGAWYIVELGLSSGGPAVTDGCNFNYLGTHIGETPPPCE